MTNRVVMCSSPESTFAYAYKYSRNASSPKILPIIGSGCTSFSRLHRNLADRVEPLWSVLAQLVFCSKITKLVSVKCLARCYQHHSRSILSGPVAGVLAAKPAVLP